MSSRHTRLWILAAFTLFSIVLTAFLPRISQNPAYHDFADQRLYGLVQAYPLLAVPLLILLFPASYTRTIDLPAVGVFI